MALLRLPEPLVKAQGAIAQYQYMIAKGNDMPEIIVSTMEGNDQIWADGYFLNVSTNPTATVPAHPLESGSSIADHRIIEPIEATLTILATKATYRQLYSEIRGIHDNSQLVRVHTRTRIMRNMAITAFPDEQNPDMFDAITLDVTLKEMIFVTPSQGTMTSENTRVKADANTVQQGQKSPGGLITAVNENAQQQALERRIKGGK